MTFLTDEELKDIEDSLSRITKGDWICDGCEVGVGPGGWWGDLVVDYVYEKEDCYFIGKSPQWIKSLLEEVKYYRSKGNDNRRTEETS